MENKVIWKSWDLMSQEEKNEFLDDGDLLACYLDNYHEDFATYVEEEFEEYCREVNNDYFNNYFGKSGSWILSLKNVKIEVQGKLGLWDGTHTIYPVKFDNLYDAIQKCLEDYNEIYEDEQGNLKRCSSPLNTQKLGVAQRTDSSIPQIKTRINMRSAYIFK